MYSIGAFYRPANERRAARYVFVCSLGSACYDIPADSPNNALTVSELAERFIADECLPWSVSEVRPDGDDYLVICEDSNLN